MHGQIFYSGPSLLDGKPIVGIAVYSEVNRKTGPGVQTYILRSDLWPSEAAYSGEDKSVCGECPLRASETNVCYVEFGKGVWNVYSGYKSGWYDADSSLSICSGRFVRLGTYGDPAAIPFDLWRRMTELASNWAGYTHCWRTCDQRFRSILMASVESPEDVEIAHGMGWRTFRLRDSTEPMLRNEIICPSSDEGGFRRQCNSCRACRGSGTGQSVVIMIHGKPWKTRNLLRLRIRERGQEDEDMPTMKASEMIEDMNLYPRVGGVDDVHVQHLEEALLAGEKLPEVIVWKKTKQIVDGFHRRRAYIRAYGDDAKIPVIFREYKSEGEMFLDAVRLNSGHGRRITTGDTSFIATRAKAFGLNDVQVSKALRMTTQKLTQLTTTKAASFNTNPTRRIEKNYNQSESPNPRFTMPVRRNELKSEYEFDGESGVATQTNDANSILLLDEILCVLEADVLPDTEYVKNKLTEIRELIDKRFSGTSDASQRRRVAKLLAQWGATHIAKLVKEIGLDSDKMVELLEDHYWFTIADAKCYLTPEGRNAVE